MSNKEWNDFRAAPRLASWSQEPFAGLVSLSLLYRVRSEDTESSVAMKDTSSEGLCLQWHPQKSCLKAKRYLAPDNFSDENKVSAPSPPPPWQNYFLCTCPVCHKPDPRSAFVKSMAAGSPAAVTALFTKCRFLFSLPRPAEPRSPELGSRNLHFNLLPSIRVYF